MRSAVNAMQKLLQPTGRFVGWLTHKSHATHLIVLALLVTLPSIWGGWVADDYHHRLRLTGSERLPQVFDEHANPLLDLFTFADGDPLKMRQLMDVGFWPWWALPELRAAFFRPVTSTTHWIDYHLFPDHPAIMHLHSMLWFAALIGAVSMLYRRLMGRTCVAGLAALLYLLDDAHAMPAGWLANRNSLLAALFGVLAILAHHRWRRMAATQESRWPSPIAVAGPVLLALSLLSKEAGIATCAYLLAYAVFLDQGSWRRRIGALLPYAIVAIVWRNAWTRMGYGVWGINLYVDPLTEPLLFVKAVIERLPIYLLGQWLLPPSDACLLALDLGVFIHYWIVALVAVFIILIVVLRILPRDSMTWFWLTGMFLSVLPVCAALPGDRVLCFVGLGAFGLMARFLEAVFAQPEEPDSPESGRSVERRIETPSLPTRMLGRTMIVVHLVLSPLVLVLHAAMPVGPPSLLEKLEVRLPRETRVEGRSVIVVTAPIPILAGYLAEKRALDGLPVPAHTRVLAPSQPEPAAAYRPDDRTLVISPPEGYLRLSFDRLARSLNHPMPVGHRVELTGMTAEVLEQLPDGRPAQVAFEFDVPLEDSSLIWLWWCDGAFVPFVPPAVGSTIELAQSDEATEGERR